MRKPSSRKVYKREGIGESPLPEICKPLCASPGMTGTGTPVTEGWAWGWRRKGWIKSDKKPALNPDLWTMLLDLTRQHEMHYHWVKGHAENEYNNRCDALAVAEREKYAKQY